MFPQERLRRLRRGRIRPLVRETGLSATDLIAPLFIEEKAERPRDIPSLPGQKRYPLGHVADYAERLYQAGIRAVILFGLPAYKDEEASSAYAPDGVIQSAIRGIRERVPDMAIFTDVCACEYTTHGHCGVFGPAMDGNDLLNDPSLELMNRIAVSHAEAGADAVAPSCMLDGVVQSIRMALDDEGFEEVLILSYSTKFASSMYGPFRDAADSGCRTGDRRTYQIDYANFCEAVRESELDALEGADILMVKPAGYYLDVLAAVSEIGLPVAAYQVSGEYAMIRAAALNGWIDERDVVMETLTCLKRAGADLIITYFAESAVRWINEEQ
ncbi:MAG: porphobilinogen synthase [Methanoculleaceae archaeon]